MSHKTYKIAIDGRAIVHIPTLGKFYEVPIERLNDVPEYVDSEQPHQGSPKRKYTSGTLVLTDECNLACVYCYEFGCPKKTPEKMASSTITKVVDFLVENALATNRQGVRLNFFGGEPTLALEEMMFAKNLLDQKCHERDLKTRYTIVTNGCMSSEVADWLMKNISSIGISFDGTKEVQDRQRSGSFDRAFARARQIYGTCGSKRVSLRMTVSAWSVSKMEEIVEFIATNFPGVSLYAEPLFGIGRGKTATVSMPDPEEFFNQCLLCYKLAEKLGMKFITSIGKSSKSKTSFCGANGNAFVVTASGDILSCPRMSLSKELSREAFCYGKLCEDGVVIDVDKKQSLHRLLAISNIPMCSDCFAQLACRGDCPANKSIGSPDNFYNEPSYRCEAIKRYVARLMLMLVS